MQSSNSLTYLLFPLMVLIVLGVLVLVLRWAFGRRSSVVAAPPKSGTPDEYGLLVAAASPATFIEAELIRRKLEDAGLRASIASTTDGPRVMVWPNDLQRAQHVVEDRG